MFKSAPSEALSLLARTRRTPGSNALLLPPLLSQCLYAAACLHEYDPELHQAWADYTSGEGKKPRRALNMLTVAGRALSKHAVRTSDFCQFSRSLIRLG